LKTNAKSCSNCFSSEGGAFALKLSACARCGLEVYCSKDCQRAHWKANHKHHCIAKADRSPRPQDSTDAPKVAAASEEIVGEKCAICLNLLSDASTSMLPCAHVFHSTCVSELRNFCDNQICPLCRTPLPSGPEMIYIEATQRFLTVDRLVELGHAPWNALPADAQMHSANWMQQSVGGELQPRKALLLLNLTQGTF